MSSLQKQNLKNIDYLMELIFSVCYCCEQVLVNKETLRKSTVKAYSDSAQIYNLWNPCIYITFIYHVSMYIYFIYHV